MPFGKYKGREVRDLPRSYLQWLLDNIDFRSEELKEEVEEWVNGGSQRSYYVPPPPPPSEPPPWSKTSSTSKVADGVRKWYRALVMKYHPDRGGSHEVMVAINEAYELLKHVLELEG